MAENTDGRLVLNSQNHAAVIVIVTTTWLVWTLGVLIVRLIGKAKFRSFDGEEISVVVSSLLAVICSSFVFAAIDQGLGKAQKLDSTESVQNAYKYLYIADIFYVCTLGVSRAAIIFLIRRLTRVRSHITACYAIAGLVGLWMLVSVLTVAIRCDTAVPWHSQNTATCSNLFTRWATVEAIGMASELATLGLVVHIIASLQMPLVMKFKGVFAFTTRIPLIAIITLRLYYLHQAFATSNLTFTLTNSVITTQSSLHFSVIAASFAYLKPFLSFFDSGLGATVKLDTLHPSSYAQEQSKSGGSGKMNSNMSGRQGGRSSEPQKRTSSQDSKAPVIMRTQEYKVEYVTENR